MHKLLCLVFVFTASAALGEAVTLDPKAFKHITFEDIPQTSYSADSGSLKIEVNKSSSFLLLPYAAPKTVKKVKFLWKSQGDLKVTSAEHEASKAGDDSQLRIGLVLAGEAPMVPFFAPAWVKAIREAMSLPSDKLVYLVVGAKHEVGSIWESPYSDSMEFRAMASRKQSDGWNVVDYTLEKPLAVVGLWVMADGDNTASIFTTWLKDLDLL